MKYLQFTFIFSFVLSVTGSAQLTGQALLDKAIKYHDPKGQWSTFDQNVLFQESRPDGKLDTTKVYFGNSKSTFTYLSENDSIARYYKIQNDQCEMTLNGVSTFTEEEIKKHRMTSDFAKLIRNYYTYLWGLPMKLKDPGTIIHEKIVSEKFQEVDCHKLKVTYEASIGKDTWYFYFRKDNHAMIGYKFYKDETKNDGEYIILEGEEKIGQIKFPKIRKWYYNKNGKYLGTDTILPKKQ